MPQAVSGIAGASKTQPVQKQRPANTQQNKPVTREKTKPTQKAGKNTPTGTGRRINTTA